MQVKIGYVRVSKQDGSQLLDLQMDAMRVLRWSRSLESAPSLVAYLKNIPLQRPRLFVVLLGRVLPWLDSGKVGGFSLQVSRKFTSGWIVMWPCRTYPGGGGSTRHAQGINMNFPEYN